MGPPAVFLYRLEKRKTRLDTKLKDCHSIKEAEEIKSSVEGMIYGDQRSRTEQ